MKSLLTREGFNPRKGRKIEYGQLVGVHWNSHKKMYSVVSMKTRKTIGLVLGYTESITLKNCTTKIDKTKRKNVIDTGVKDRHAFIVGEIESFKFEDIEKNVYYNPYKVCDFVDANKFFNGRIEYINTAKKVSLKYNFDTMRPVVKYSK